ncbi:TPA: hypothetical protein NQH12_005262 [Klebsiella oxytoca]|nr:hypothetical protein [Klebsiella oxytoca]
MFDGLRESWFISKVETVIQTEINCLPLHFKNHTEGLAHAIVLKQYQARSFVFSKMDGSRLNPRIAAVESVLTFIDLYGGQRQILVNGQDCLSALKIISVQLLKRLEMESTTAYENGYIEMFIAPFVQRALHKLDV